MDENGKKNELLTLPYDKSTLFLLIDNWKLKGETLEYLTEDKIEQMRLGVGLGEQTPVKRGRI